MRLLGSKRGFLTLLALFWMALLPGSGAGEPHNGPPSGVPLLTITALDVGQGDGLLIQAPNGKVAMIDAGPGGNSALLLNQLQRLNLSQIDLLIGSHPHEDHIGGMLQVLDSFRVLNFADPGTTHTTVTYQNLIKKLKEKGIPVREARKGQRYKLDERLFLEVLAPRDPLLKGTPSDLNNNSVVIRLEWGDFSMLFTGDAEAEAEERLVADKVHPVNILKVGHHGSRSSSIAEVIDAIKPEVAVISCEIGNDYGHPHSKTLTTFQKRSTQIYRTDQDGQVRLITDGSRLWVKTYTRTSFTAQKSTVQPDPVRIDGPIMLRPTMVVVRDSQPPGTPGSSGSSASSAGGGDQIRGVPIPPQTPGSPEEATGEHASDPGSGEFMASQKSKVFHKSGCAAAKRIVEQNRVFFASREEAIAAGREPAKDCDP